MRAKKTKASKTTKSNRTINELVYYIDVLILR